MDFIILIIGFVMLIKWADLLVDWSSSIAKKYGISSLVIGLTIVAFGTSAPELVVNMLAAFSWNTDLAISNILGSNISNILLILWITAMIYPIAMPKSTVKKEIPFIIFVSALLIGLLADWLLSKFDAAILSVLFAWFMYYAYKMGKDKTSSEKKEENTIELMTNLKASIFILIWLAWLVIGWKFIVDSAVSIASWFWLPQAFVWVTIVAIWTSLPELAASVMAAFKKDTDMAIGWIVWSNIFNTLWILWATWLIHPLKGYEWINFDLLVNLAVSMLVFLAAFTFKKNFLTKKEWSILLLSYLSYISYLIYNLPA